MSRLLLAAALAVVLACGLTSGLTAPASAQTATTAAGRPGAATPAAAVPASPAVPASLAAAPATSAPSAGDDASTRTVDRIVAVLVAFALLLLGLAVWFWFATRPVPRHLDALDAMGSRPWMQAGPAERSAMLAPVHERRGERRDDEVIAPPEPADAEGQDAAPDEVGAAEPVAEQEPFPPSAAPALSGDASALDGRETVASSPGDEEAAPESGPVAEVDAEAESAVEPAPRPS
jgi:hypothetical protein